MNSYQPRFTITNRLTAAITQIERVRGFLEGADLSAAWVRDMGREALLLEAHHSTHIEGTRLTLDQSARLMNGESVPEADPEDSRELLNYRAAFEFVSDYLAAGEPITEGLIREIHRRLVAGVRGDQAAPGEYRRIQNYVANSVTGAIVYTPPAALEVPVMMAGLVRWLNASGEVHPVLVSGIAQFQLVHIHPFLDGNGRTSRLLSTLCLYRAGYDFKRLFTISEYYDRDRPAFYRALQSVRANEMDLTPWLEYFTAGLQTQMVEVKKRGEAALASIALTGEHKLTERQRMALEYIIKKGHLSIRDFEGLYPSVNRRSLQRDLKALVDKGLLISEGGSNQLIYLLKP